MMGRRLSILSVGNPLDCIISVKFLYADEWLLSGIDSSSAAIDLARDNAQLNCHGRHIDFVCEEAEKFMGRAAKLGHTWDIVILGRLSPNPEKSILAWHQHQCRNAVAIVYGEQASLRMAAYDTEDTGENSPFQEKVRRVEERMRREMNKHNGNI